MRSYLLGTLALVTAVAVGGVGSQAQAAPIHHGPSHGHGHVAVHYGGYRTIAHHGHSYHVRYYPREYRGWARYCWFPRYRCYGYYNAVDASWYFWSAQYGCFMPVSYLTTFAPAPVAVNVGVVAPAPIGVVAPGPVPVGGVATSDPGLPPGAVPFTGAPPMP